MTPVGAPEIRSVGVNGGFEDVELITGTVGGIIKSEEPGCDTGVANCCAQLSTIKLTSIVFKTPVKAGHQTTRFTIVATNANTTTVRFNQIDPVFVGLFLGDFTLFDIRIF